MKIKNKIKMKAQVSVFVVIAVIVVAGAGIAYYAYNSSAGSLDKEYFSQPGIKSDMNILKNSLINCLEINSADALELIGIQGGYYEEPEKYFDLGWAIIPYYYDRGSYSMPSLSEVENEIGKAVDDNLNLCLDSIELDNYELSYGKPTTEVTINKDNVEFSIDHPITIKREDKRIILELEDFPVIVDSSIKEMYEIADYVTESHKEDSEMICISCVVDMAEERNLYVDMVDFADETSTLVIVSTQENQTSPYVYEFLNKYPAESNLNPEVS